MPSKRSKAPKELSTPVKPAREAETLIDKEAAGEFEAAPSSTRKRARSIDDSVRKALMDNIKGWSNEAFHCVLRNGASLCEAVKRAKIQA